MRGDTQNASTSTPFLSSSNSANHWHQPLEEGPDDNLEQYKDSEPPSTQRQSTDSLHVDQNFAYHGDTHSDLDNDAHADLGDDWQKNDDHGAQSDPHIDQDSDASISSDSDSDKNEFNWRDLPKSPLENLSISQEMLDAIRDAKLEDDITSEDVLKNLCHPPRPLEAIHPINCDASRDEKIPCLLMFCAVEDRPITCYSSYQYCITILGHCPISDVHNALTYNDNVVIGCQRIVIEV